MNELKQKLISRKLWVAVITALLTALADQFGLTGPVQAAIAALGGTYVIGQGFADAGAQGAIFRTVTEKLKSRKLWSTLAVAAFIAFAKGLGINLSDSAAMALAGIAGAYNIGQGAADAGTQGQGNEI